jgi:hypothetical protein
MRPQLAALSETAIPGKGELVAISSEKVEVATCNNCGKREYSASGEFEGVSGTANVGRSDYGFKVSWYSCSTAPGHLGKAIRAAIDAGPPSPE